MKNLKRLITALLVATICFFAISCVKPTVVKSDENTVAITADSKYFAIAEDTTLIDYMNKLKADGLLDFTIADGMITAIGGKQNPADFSSCWMLYTSDSELSNSAWGILEVDGEVYASAICGATDLIIKEGEVYLWAFVTF